MAKNDKILKTDAVTKKTFSYTLEGININFTLRVDVKKELKAAKDILIQAIKDFDEEIKKLS